MPGFFNSIIADARTRPAVDRHAPLLQDNGQGGLQNSEPVIATTPPAQVQVGDKPVSPLTADKPAAQHEIPPSTLGDSKPDVPPIRHKQVIPRPEKKHQAVATSTNSYTAVDQLENLSDTPIQKTNSAGKKTIDLKQSLASELGQRQPPPVTKSQSSTDVHSTIEAQDTDKAPENRNKKTTHEQRTTVTKKIREGETVSASSSKPKVMKLADTLSEQIESSPAIEPLDGMAKQEAATELKTEQQGEEKSPPHTAEIVTTVHEAEKMQDSEAATQTTNLNSSFAVTISEDTPWYERPAEEKESVASGNEKSAGVHIGQIDIVIQAESKQTVAPRTAQSEQSGFSSRYHLRRL